MTEREKKGMKKKAPATEGKTEKKVTLAAGNA